MEEATGAPSSIAVFDPKRLRASGRDGDTVITRPPSPLTMLFSRHTKRREFITLLGGAAAAWPLAGRAQQREQQRERMRRVGALISLGANDPEAQARIAAFLQGLQELGWSVGRNVHIDIRWSAGSADEVRKNAAELVMLAPDVILSNGTPAAAALLQVTRKVAIVFTVVADPVGAGLVSSLARPGGNATGFT